MDPDNQIFSNVPLKHVRVCCWPCAVVHQWVSRAGARGSRDKGAHRALCLRCAKRRPFWTRFPRWPRSPQSLLCSHTQHDSDSYSVEKLRMSQNIPCFTLKAPDCCLNLLFLRCGRSTPDRGWFSGWVTGKSCARAVPALRRTAPTEPLQVQHTIQLRPPSLRASSCRPGGCPPELIRHPLGPWVWDPCPLERLPAARLRAKEPATLERCEGP